jgi:hypothetical protein
MTNAAIHNQVEDRNGKAEEHLHLLQCLSAELERAMQAIARNAISDLEDSIATQEILTDRLSRLARELSAPLAGETDPGPAASGIDDALLQQIHAASAALRRLNLRYSLLLQHSTRSVVMMTSLFTSLRGQFQEVSGPRWKQQTWSCRM